MSCTVVALPLLMIISAVTAATTAVATKSGTALANALNKQNISNNESEYTPANVVNILCKEYDTVFVDKDLLIKTLEEHGATDFEEIEGKTICKVEDFSLEFYKTGDEPYKLNVAYTCKDNIDDTVNDINCEYGLNVQEESYLKLKDRLAKQKLEIEDEEILEDNSIVLTINLE